MGYKISVKKGNLLHEMGAVFMVNSSNTKLMLGQGISSSFEAICGEKLKKEMKFTYSKLSFVLKKGDIIATSSGDAKHFRYILHVVTQDYERGNRAHERFPNYKNIFNALKNIESYLKWYYNETQKEDIKIVLPLLGCGSGGLDKKTIVGLYKSFFIRNLPFFCEVVIYGKTSDDYELINKNLI
jgi:O-acetyl-ADP-ribose deacetylase (regulator of RNase III)